MASVTPNTYTVQIDSNYRDLSKFPLSTDFSVRFNTTVQTGASVNGYPYDGSTSLPTQIDPDFSRADFRVINGEIQHAFKDSGNNFYLSGIMYFTNSTETFQILQGSYRVFSLSPPTAAGYSRSGAWIAKFVPLSSNYYTSWFNYTDDTIFSTRSTFEIDVNQNLFWLFDSRGVVDFNVQSSANPNFPFYTVLSPSYQVDIDARVFNVICAFNSQGDEYVLNGIPWGYHILNSTYDIAPTLENGRSYVKTNTALDVFTTFNTNPYDPNVYFNVPVSYQEFQGQSYAFTNPTNGMLYVLNFHCLLSGQASITVCIFNKTNKTLDTTISPLFPGLPVSPLGYWPAKFIETPTKVFTVCANKSDTNQGQVFVIPYNKITNAFELEYGQYLGHDSVTGAYSAGTYSEVNTCLNTSGTYMYLAMDNTPSATGASPNQQLASMLFRLDVSNIYTGFTELSFNTDFYGNQGGSYSIINDSNYIVYATQGTTVLPFPGKGLTFLGYNEDTGYTSWKSYVNIGDTTEGNPSVFPVNVSDGKPTLFKYQSVDYLQCFISYSYGGILFTVKYYPVGGVPGFEFKPTQTWNSKISAYGDNSTFVYKDFTNRYYLIGNSSGLTYDITDLINPYQLCSQYPEDTRGIFLNDIKDVSQIVNYESQLYIVGDYYRETILPTFNNFAFLALFFRNTTQVQSRHFSKPIVQFNPYVDAGDWRRKYWDLFTIPGSSDNVSTNFSPAQYVNNGLVAWYKPNSPANVIFSDTRVIGILDLSGNGLDLYTSSDPGVCPRIVTNSVYSQNSPALLWETGETASFASTGTYSRSIAKFVIMTYFIEGVGGPIVGTPEMLPFQMNSASNPNDVYIQSSYTGVNMKYQQGLGFGYNPNYAQLSRWANPTYFGYNSQQDLAPYVVNQSLPGSTQTLGYTPITAQPVYQVKLMQNITGISNYNILIKEIIVLDFIPTEYQLSLFQNYLNAPLAVFPIVIPPLAGVYNVFTTVTEYTYPSVIHIDRVDGSDIQDVDVFPFVTNFVYPNQYIDVKSVRYEGFTEAFNIVATICTDGYIRIFRFDDYLQYRGYAELSINNLGIYPFNLNYPMYIIQPYKTADGILRFIVSTLSSNPAGETQSAWVLSLNYSLNASSSSLTVTDILECWSAYPVTNYISPPSADPINVLSVQIYTYPNSRVIMYLFVATTKASTLGYNTPGACIQIFDITGGSIGALVDVRPTPPISETPNNVGTTNRYSSNIIKYPNGKIYLFYTIVPSDDPCIVWDITDYENIVRYVTVPAGINENGQISGGYINVRDPRNASPRAMYTNPITNKVYSLDSTSLLAIGTNYLGRMSIYDYTDLNTVPSSYNIQQTFYAYNVPASMFQYYNLNFSTVDNIKVTVWNQKVWGMFNFVDSSGANQGCAFFDLSNAEYVSQNYVDNAFSTLIYSKNYKYIDGIGVGVIHKISGNGSPQWLSSLGGDYNSQYKLSTNVNISNVALDPELTYCYIAGSWQNKLMTFLNSGSDMLPTVYNIIRTNAQDVSVNSFICKLNINDGTYTWLIPGLGTNNDYFQRIGYSSAGVKHVIVCGYFSSPVMLVYTPQQSIANATYATVSNPINTILNISNISTFSSVLFSISENGSLQWSVKLYSGQQSSTNKMYDFMIDSDTVTSAIVSNASELKCIDSSGLNVQDTYTSNVFNTITQKYIGIYTFNLSGVYQKSERIEFPPEVSVEIYDINSFSAINRIIVYANCLTPLNDTIACFNKDGSFGGSVEQVLPVNKPFTQVFEYLFDSTFTDTNGNKYSQLIVNGGNPQPNYYMFIQGSVQEFDPQNINTTYLNTDIYLNKNFSIRYAALNSQLQTSVIPEWRVTLNSLVQTNKIIRKNLPSEFGTNWLSNISATQLYNVFSYTTGTVSSIMTQFFGPAPNLISTTGTYYMMYPVFGGVFVNPITTITNTNGLYQFNTLVPITGNQIAPFAYLGTYDQSVNWTLQFYPASINTDTFFDITLNSLTIPDRPIKNSQYPGIRYLNDFPYVYLMIVNTNEAGTIDNQILNNFFTTNVNRNANAIFTIPITSAGTSANYITLGSGLSARIKFSPGFYRVRVVLFDPDGNVIQFDNTPVKPIDSIFSGSVVPEKLLNIVPTVTLKRTT